MMEITKPALFSRLVPAVSLIVIALILDQVIKIMDFSEIDRTPIVATHVSSV